MPLRKSSDLHCARFIKSVSASDRQAGMADFGVGDWGGRPILDRQAIRSVRVRPAPADKCCPARS